MDIHQKKNVFICFSSKNRDLVDVYIEKLKNKASVTTGVNLEIGESFVIKSKEVLKSADYIIILLTKEFLNCTWTINELSSVFKEENRKKYIVIRYPNVLIPNYLYNTNIIDYNELVKHKDEDWDIPFAFNPNSHIIYNDLSFEVGFDIIKALKNKPITVVCGAGVSKQPEWDQLLNSMIERYLYDCGYDLTEIKQILEKIDVTGLEKAQFLQKVLKTDFYKLLGNMLYNGTTSTETTIKSVAQFCKNCKSIESVITYNFDLILEEYLQDIKCRFTPIDSKNKNKTITGLPIYHVHGILDRNCIIKNRKYDLVFCEKSYHTQYSEPYSWPNLLQLDKFSENLCVFIGISLKDPNMRRLLDVVHRNNKNTNHIIIMKRNPNNSFIDVLIEQNTNELGVSIIWIDDYEEIPKVLQVLQESINGNGVV